MALPVRKKSPPFIVDYSSWWTLLPPLPPRRLPIISLVLVLAVVVIALMVPALG